MSQTDQSHPLPQGYKLIPLKTTYLEMKARPETQPIALPDGCAVERWLQPGSSDYRELFSAVYLKAGFRVVDERVEMQPYAEEFIGKFRPAGG